MKKKINKKQDLGRNLMDAATAYIEGNGGKVIVIGGIEIQKWPLDNTFKFCIGIRFTGKKPTKQIK
jgi:hypothetical protein